MFGYRATTDSETLKNLSWCGLHGLDGFHEFINYFVVHWGLQGSLLEGKIELLLVAIEAECIRNMIISLLETQSLTRFLVAKEASANEDEVLVHSMVNEVDSMDDEIMLIDISGATQKSCPACMPAIPRAPCNGIVLTFPPGQNEHVSYPFTLHRTHALPWNYQSINNKFFLQARSCKKKPIEAGSTCKNCCDIEWVQWSIPRHCWAYG